MANYVLLYHGGPTMENTTDEERQAEMAAWGAWYKSMGEAVVDGGNPFAGAMTVGPDGSSEGAGSGLTGYTIVSADSISAAAEMAKGCPILKHDASVQVYETMQVM